MTITRGFLKNAMKMAREQGIPLKNAKGELAAATRRAGAKARRANPRLNRVKGC
jgi:hypothetical protein